MESTTDNSESEAPPQQPDPKRPKMSTTTSDDEADVAEEKKPRYKRRKVAIFFAYCGVGYQGMQKNPGAKTIEGDLEEALFHAGAVPEKDRFSPRRYDFARSARTDKGVSAVGQVVSGRFYVDPPGLVDRLNSNLSPQIRVFGFKRTTGAFNAKKFCDRRRYVYLIPVFALDPAAHRDRESVLAASLDSDSGNVVLVKCVECSDRGRKVEGLMGKRSYELRGMSFESDIPSNSCDANVESGTICGDLEMKDKSSGSDIPSNSCDAKVEAKVENGIISADSEIKDESFESDIPSNSIDAKVEVKVENGLIFADSEMKDMTLESDILSNSCDAKVEVRVENETSRDDLTESDTNVTICADSEVRGTGFESDIPSNICDAKVDGNSDEVKCSTRSDFRYGESEKERFNRILKYYEGTHNFHNFTTRTKPEDPAAKRFIISFNADTVVSVKGMDFVKCEVVGQSFMLHQIRKMIGLAVAVMRNFTPESLIEKALQKDVKVNVPTAPEVGLYLDECFFSSYNQKWKDSHEELSMKAYKEEAETFKMKYIYPHIGLTEQKEGVVALWCHSLNHRNYPDLLDGENSINKNSVEGENIVVE